MNKDNKFKEQLMLFKSLLLANDLEDFKALYTKENYEEFLDLAIYLLDEDTLFLTLNDSIIEKIKETAYNLRFPVESKEQNDKVNDLIGLFNNYDVVRKTNFPVLELYYLTLNEKIREVNLDYKSDLEDYILNDRLVLEDIKLNNLDNVDDKYFFSTMNELMVNYPEFLKDVKHKNTIEEHIEEIRNTSGIENKDNRVKAKRTRENLNRYIYKKGEGQS